MSAAPSIEAVRVAILGNALTHVPFDGWTEKALLRGAEDAGIAPEMVLDAFPGGVPDAIEFAAEQADQAMLAALREKSLEEMRVRDRIAAAIRARLTLSAPHRETIQRALTYLSLPHNAPLGAKIMWRTVDKIWYATGDRATDFNFYTKRGLLAGVYSATLLFWLNDHSPENADTWRFLDRRIDEVLRIPKFMSKLQERLSHLPLPFDVLRPGARRRHKMR